MIYQGTSDPGHKRPRAQSTDPRTARPRTAGPWTPDTQAAGPWTQDPQKPDPQKPCPRKQATGSYRGTPTDSDPQKPDTGTTRARSGRPTIGQPTIATIGQPTAGRPIHGRQGPTDDRHADPRMLNRGRPSNARSSFVRQALARTSRPLSNVWPSLARTPGPRSRAWPTANWPTDSSHTCDGAEPVGWPKMGGARVSGWAWTDDKGRVGVGQRARAGESGGKAGGGDGGGGGGTWSTVVSSRRAGAPSATATISYRFLHVHHRRTSGEAAPLESRADAVTGRWESRARRAHLIFSFVSNDRGKKQAQGD